MKHYYSPWSMWSVAVFFVLFQFFLQLSIGTLLPALKQDFALTPSDEGLLSSAFYLAYVSLQLPAGILVDRIGSRRLLAWGALLCALACCLFAMSQGFWLACTARFIMGIGSSCAFLSTMSVIAYEFPINRFAFIVGITETIGMVATLLVNLSLAWLLSLFDWRNLMLGFGGLCCLIGFMCWVVLPDQHRKILKVDQKHNVADFYGDVLWLLRQPRLWLNGLYSGILFTIVTVFAALWGLEYLRKYQGLGLAISGFQMGCVFLGVALASPFTGLIYNRLKDSRTCLAWASWLSMLLMLLFIYWKPQSPVLVSCLCFMMGVFSTTYLFNFAIARDAVLPHIVTTAMGLTNTLCMLVTPILQSAIGFVLDFLSGKPGPDLNQSLFDYQLALSILPISLGIAGVVAYFLPKPESLEQFEAKSSNKG